MGYDRVTYLNIGGRDIPVEKPQKPLAWLNDPDLKEQVLLRMKAHRAEDSIIQGHYQVYAPEVASQYKGCLLGCTVPKRVDAATPTGHGGLNPSGSWHQEVEVLYGIPVAVAYIMENIFEGLPFSEAVDFAVDSIEAIAVGADLSEVAWDLRSIARNDDDYLPVYTWSQRRDDLMLLLREAPVPEPTS